MKGYDMADNLIKIGLYGTPGAGKSTTLQIMREICLGQGIPVARIKLADPLYEAQAAIYKIAGQALSDFYDQDGELLNFLGHYLRKLNPRVLLDRFSLRVEETSQRLRAEHTVPCIIVCDDLRRADSDHVRSHGFRLGRVVADAASCVRRREVRGDRSLGSASHVTEQGLDEIVPDFVVENNSSLEELREMVKRVLEEWLR